MTTTNSVTSDIKKMRKMLIIFTLLHVVYFFLWFSSLDFDLMDTLASVVLSIFYIIYIVFIWSMPLEKSDKWKETILACIFGLFAMWMWVQFNELEKNR